MISYKKIKQINKLIKNEIVQRVAKVAMWSITAAIQ